MAEKQKLFCEISPAAYKLSVLKCRSVRFCKDAISRRGFAETLQREKLPALIYAHKSLIRRKLGDVDMRLQENKAINLGLAAPKVSGVIIKPGETFSFWNLVGSCTGRKGYKEGLMIDSGEVKSCVGGGMCQFTNLIHWLILHTPLEITEHHHHDGIDMFPDYGRKIPFGMGTAIMYNYLDYRFFNNSDMVFQLIVHTTDEYLCGEIRAEKPIRVKYHISVEGEYFSEENGVYYRNNLIYRECKEKSSHELMERRLLKSNHAKVMYDLKFIDKSKIRPAICGDS